MSLPPRALEAANAIIARVPGTTWTPQDRDLAAALIARATRQDKALEACRLYLEGQKMIDAGHETGGRLYKDGQLKCEAAAKMMEQALRR